MGTRRGRENSQERRGTPLRCCRPEMPPRSEAAFRRTVSEWRGHVNKGGGQEVSALPVLLNGQGMDILRKKTNFQTGPNGRTGAARSVRRNRCRRNGADSSAGPPKVKSVSSLCYRRAGAWGEAVKPRLIGWQSPNRQTGNYPAKTGFSKRFYPRHDASIFLPAGMSMDFISTFEP